MTAEGTTPKEVARQRVTAQRRLLLNLIRQTEGHLDADELYRLAKEREPRISLSTIYRNLRLFKRLNLIDERHFDEGHHHYEAKGSSEHHHLVCLGCGQVMEFENPLAQLKAEVCQEKGFEVLAAEFLLMGYCSNCRQRRNC